MIGRFLLGLGLMIVVVSASGRAGAEPVYLGFDDYEIAFEPPEGYCPIDRSNRLEDFLATQFEKMGGEQLLLLDFSVWCDDLATIRQGRAATAPRYTVLFVVLKDGRPLQMPGVSHRDFKKAMRYLESGVLDAEVKAAQRQMYDRTDLGRMNITIGAERDLGILAEDRYALYTGHTNTVRRGGLKFPVVGVASKFLMSGLFMGFYSYQRDMGEGSVQELLEEQRAHVPYLIGMN